MSKPLVTVDVGNSRVKLGLFVARAETGLPMPSRVLSLPAGGRESAELTKWLGDLPRDTPWWIASVNRPAAAWLQSQLLGRPVRTIEHADLPIHAAVERPDHVGIDRLAGAVAANRLRDSRRAAIVIHVGSAITANLVTADGVFRGGAILPGIGMSARALDEFTDLLPRTPLEELREPPPVLGKSTLDAIHSGLYWGAIGAMRELISRLSASLGEPVDKPEVFLTGGAAPAVAAELDPAARYVEHLVLAGIALAKDG